MTDSPETPYVSPQVNYRTFFIPPEMWEDITRHSKARKISRSEYVRRAIARYNAKAPEIFKQMEPVIPRERQPGEHSLADCLAIVQEALLEERLSVPMILPPDMIPPKGN